MTENFHTDYTRQTVVTRLASINSALTFLTLTNDKPAAVTVDEMLSLAEHLEQWAWRDLIHEVSVLAPTLPSVSPPDTPALPSPDQPAPATPALAAPPHANGNGQPVAKASTKQVSAIFAIGKTKGYSAEQIKQWVKGQFSKSVDDLSSPEASKLITYLKAA